MTNEINLQTTYSNETLKEKFLTTKGRINRLTFLKRSIILIAVNFFAVFFTIFLTMLGTMSFELPQWAGLILLWIMGVFLIPDYCINVKRLHDLGKDATLAKIFLGVNIISLTYNFTLAPTETFSAFEIILTALLLGFFACLLFIKGDDGANEYGN